MTVEIGREATDRPATFPPTYTIINKGIAADGTGPIKSIDIWPETDLTGCKIGIFFLVGGTTYKCRSSVTLGNVSAGFHNISGLSLSAVAGDLIGIYFATGDLERTTGGEVGEYYVSGDKCDVDDQAAYALLSGNAISLGGYITILRATIQPMTDVFTPTAKAHGNITTLGETPCIEHGQCWNTTGLPTIADDKTTLGAVASAPHPFESTLTELVGGVLYYVRTYATDTAGTVYSSEISFLAPNVFVVETEINPVVTKAAGGGGTKVLGPDIEVNPTYFGEGGGGWNVITDTESNPTHAEILRFRPNQVIIIS